MPAVPATNSAPRSAASLAQESDDFFQATYNKFLDTLATADSMTFPVLDEYDHPFHAHLASSSPLHSYWCLFALSARPQPYWS